MHECADCLKSTQVSNASSYLKTPYNSSPSLSQCNANQHCHPSPLHVSFAILLSHLLYDKSPDGTLSPSSQSYFLLQQYHIASNIKYISTSLYDFVSNSILHALLLSSCYTAHFFVHWSSLVCFSSLLCFLACLDTSL